MSSHPFISHTRPILSDAQLLENSKVFYEEMDTRRTVRHFSTQPVPKAVIENIIQTASTAPSGAHKQPWTFAVISSPEMKRKIRIAAEKEEQENYQGRMSDEWIRDLEPLGTDENKPFLEDAPYLIAVFKKAYNIHPEGKQKNYYVNESVGLAAGFLIAAIHQAGLCSLTHTPSPMNFLEKILERPKNERAVLLLPVGYPSEEAVVPDIQRRPLEDVSVWY
ncbi:MAG: Nitroreductase family protein [uncultured Aureispira sp.]|jgi:nitroreductase|uniref:Nitroreductase family protein n=1 Tax=uncultured Aureispira sp. TaxID=1331704 RepID=A0A6S6RRP9_9BACT|nr:MAG: Nitroreductase family protein [uncultured Aureispira sp.]